MRLISSLAVLYARLLLASGRNAGIRLVADVAAVVFFAGVQVAAEVVAVAVAMLVAAAVEPVVVVVAVPAAVELVERLEIAVAAVVVVAAAAVVVAAGDQEFEGQRQNLVGCEVQLSQPDFVGREQSSLIHKYENDIGTMDNKCPVCHAKKFKRESPGLCCSGGKVQLPPLPPPPEPLYSLLMGHHPDHRHFIDRIRQYNGCFQMTSFGAKQIKETGFMPTFKVQGQVYHLCGSLLPETEQQAQFLQIYFVGDDEKEAHIRSHNYPGVKPDLVKQLQHMLHEVNNYIKDLKTALDKVPLECRNFQVMIHADRMPANAHKGRFNAPSANEVALVIVGQQFQQRDIILESRNAKQQRISELHRAYDALQYPPMFCYGEDGYSVDVLQQDTADKLGPTTKLPVKKTVSAAQFYSWRIMLRDTEENYLLRYCALLSQFLVDEYAKIETEKLNFLKYNQSKLRSEEYIHLRDEVGRYDADQIGQRVVLPSSFIGGPRYMHERAQDAMSYVRHYGSSDLFITFTCNPKWKEIQRELYPGQKHYQRHDIIARVFHMKVKEFMDLIVKGQVFGKVRCHMLSVEWQKRGLPHIHCLLWLEEAITADMVDKVVCAEIPDVDRDPLLYDIVKANMIHGPCGRVNTFSPCMKDGCCTKRYPRPFVQETQRGLDGYPLYRRRTPEDGGFTVNLKGFQLDNRWVVPYNPVLLRTFESHINVEITNSVKSIKYVCKYITKGNDQAAFILKNDKDIDEIEIYESGRYISSSEAVWKILGFPIHERYPAVIHLAVHLENGQRVYFTAQNIHNKVVKPPETTLSAFFNLCKIDEFARTLLYVEVPSYYVWQQNKKFTRRRRGEKIDQWPGIKKDSALGRVYTIHPNNVECYHLRLLLHHVRGPTSFSYLKTVSNVEYPTFKAACMAMGLLEDDKQWQYTIEEAILSSSSFKLRELFSVILVFCHPSDPRSLWEKYKDSFSEDIQFQHERQLQDSALSTKDKAYNQCLILIEDTVQTLGGQRLMDYGLPQPERFETNLQNREYMRETNFDLEDLKKKVHNAEASLTGEQSSVYQKVLNSLESGDGLYPECAGKIIIPHALATIVTELPDLIAKIYPDVADIKNKPIEWLCERAILSPKNDTAAEVNSILLKSFTGEDIYYKSFDTTTNRDDAVHLWEKYKDSFSEDIQFQHERQLQDSALSTKDKAYNQCLILIEDTVQTLGGQRLMDYGLPQPERFETNLQNREYMRETNFDLEDLKKKVHNAEVSLTGEQSSVYQKVLNSLESGDGLYPECAGKIIIPHALATVVTELPDLIAKIYPDVADIKNKPIEWLCERAILSPKNDTAAEVNSILLKSFIGEDIYYKSFDTTTNRDDARGMYSPLN
ncbi:uncharacterized protein LOC129233404 [Uloborus diversus]|uniref:uncharacterized protein LOC129233404 n=1 Tax=Uloborus diversus TaxID=327109 RepID=UPI0024096286|nr:uncharacterized protein LOC129233404 [Uloborus diversus]